MTLAQTSLTNDDDYDHFCGYAFGEMPIPVWNNAVYACAITRQMENNGKECWNNTVMEQGVLMTGGFAD